jgi:3-oxoacyl-[acyl-carrier protein] reductase
MGGRFEGRTALVTGAGSPSGIGLASARRLGREGARVAVASTTDRIHERVAELAADGIDAVGATADLTDPVQARRLVDGVLERFGVIDVLVNNAGMVQTGADAPGADEARFPDVDDERWRHDLALNLDTAFFTTRAALPGMLEHGYGRIVMVSSVTGPNVTNPGSTGYATAKAGMDGMMRTLAIETARAGITVNSVAPGWIASGSQTDEEAVAGRHTPIGRSGRPEEIAEAVAFLASEGASYVTGVSLVVDGGNILQEYKGPPEGWY